MQFIPGYNYEQSVSIVSSTASAINDEIQGKAPEWIMSQLVDKPAANETYIVFVKIQPVVAP